MFITVIVPIRNESPYILNTLTELAAQDYAPDRFEVIVVDGCSSDDTVLKASRFMNGLSNFRLLRNPKRLASAGRNVGICAAQGDAVVIVDGHCQIRNPSFITNIAEAFTESKAEVLGRPQPLNVTDSTLLQRAIAAVRNSRLGHHPESFIYSDQARFVPAKSVGIAYRREVFEKVGLFDESFDAHEDGEFNYRCDAAGLKCYFTPKIRVTYYPRNSLGSLFNQMIRYGRGRVRLLRKHPETFGLGSFLPLIFLLGLIVGLPLTLLHPAFTAIYFGCILLYTLMTASIGIASGLLARDLSFAIYVPLVSLTLHAGAGYGTLAELLSRKGKR